MLVNELVEDATSVLDIGCLPDEQQSYKEMKEKYGQDEEEKQMNPKLMSTYRYSHDLKWKYDMLEMVLKAYNEPMLNLHFMGPYLKNHCASQNSYDLIFQIIRVLPPKQRALVLDHLREEIQILKDDLIFKMEEGCVVKILPLFHIMIHMVLNF